MRNQISITFFIILIVAVNGCQSSINAQNNPAFTTLAGTFPNLSSPVWSSADEEILASSFFYPQIQSEIYKIDLRTQKKELILEAKGNILAQSWSPDDEKIAFVSFGSDRYQRGVWIVDLSGENPVYIGLGHAASWSPDGDLLAIIACEQLSEKNQSIALIRIHDIETGDERVIYSSNNCAAHFYLAWSPDGKMLAFSYDTKAELNEPNSQINLLDLRSNTVEKVSDTSWSPTWSPDSEMIAFVKSNHGFADTELVLYDIRKSCQKVVNNLSIPIIGGVAWSSNGTKWAITGGGSLDLVDVENLLGKDFFENENWCK